MVMRLSYRDQRRKVSAVKVIAATLTFLQPSVVYIGRQLAQTSLLAHPFCNTSLILLYLVKYIVGWKLMLGNA